MSAVRPITHLERAALRKMCKTQDKDFAICRFERIVGYATPLSGGPTRTLKSGPNRGKVRVTSITHKAVVTDDEHQAERRFYEIDTGLCGECYGTGQVFQGWSKATGTSFRTCPMCGGSGKAVAP